MSTDPEIESEWFFTGADGVAGAAASGTSYADQPPPKASSPLHSTVICMLVMTGGEVLTGDASLLDGDSTQESARFLAKQAALSKRTSCSS